MDTETINGDLDSTNSRAHDAAVVFGAAAAGAAVARTSVRATCEAVGLPRSTYYYRSHRSVPAIELEQKVVLRLHELRDRFPNDGYRRMTQQLQEEGFHVNRKRIARLIQLHGLSTRQPKTATRASRAQAARAPGATPRGAARPTGPHHAWLSDIAYVRIQCGLVYAAAVVDVGSREVIGYAISHQINRHLISLALHSAIRLRRPASGGIHLSTCGNQYLMRGYRELLRQYGLTPGDVASPMSGSNRIVEMPEYGTWEEVNREPLEFVRAVHSRERIDRLLGQMLVEPR